MERVLNGVGLGCVAGLPVVMLLGCPATTPMDVGTGASPSAGALFTLVTETDSFEDWGQFPGAEGIIESAPPHGPTARVFINGLVEEALNNFTGSLPDGAIIAKENIGEGTGDKATSLTIMWKVAGFDPENNDWFWTNVTPEGVVNAEGKVEGCLGCHGSVRDNDFVFLHDFGGG